MAALAPRICPHCDREYDDYRDDFEIGRTSYFHTTEREICIRENGVYNTVRMTERGVEAV
jgi:hypothetical protein